MEGIHSYNLTDLIGRENYGNVYRHAYGILSAIDRCLLGAWSSKQVTHQLRSGGKKWAGHASPRPRRGGTAAMTCTSEEGWSRDGVRAGLTQHGSEIPGGPGGVLIASPPTGEQSSGFARPILRSSVCRTA